MSHGAVGYWFVRPTLAGENDWWNNPAPLAYHGGSLKVLILSEAWPKSPTVSMICSAWRAACLDRMWPGNLHGAAPHGPMQCFR